MDRYTICADHTLGITHDVDPDIYSCPTIWGPIPATHVAVAAAAYQDSCLECLAGSNHAIEQHPDPRIIYTYACITAVLTMPPPERIRFTTGWGCGERVPAIHHPIAEVITVMTDSTKHPTQVYDTIAAMTADDAWRVFNTSLIYIADFAENGRAVNWDYAEWSA